MAEVSQNSPGGAALSNNGKGANPKTLDLRSWQGLTEVLKRAREANLSPTDYAEFRNLILQYAQRGGDTEYLKKIETTIASFSAPRTSPPAAPEPVIPPEASPSASTDDAPVPNDELLPPINTFAATTERRKTPSFLPVHPGEYPPHPEPTVPPEPEPVAPDPTPVASRPVIEPQAFAAPPQPTPEARAAVPSQLNPAVPLGQISPASQTSSNQDYANSQQFQFKTLEEHKARIADIKRVVNSRVGNPATLMDSRNQAGREYMAALLGAMKATAGGGAALDSAMMVLEQAYAKILEELQTAPAVVAPVSPPASTPEVPARDGVSMPTQPQPPNPTLTPSPVPPVPIPIPVPVPPATSAPSPVTVELASRIPPATTVDTAELPVTPTAPISPTPVTPSEVAEVSAANNHSAESRVPMLDLPPLPGDDTVTHADIPENENTERTDAVAWEQSTVIKPAESQAGNAWQELPESPAPLPTSTSATTPAAAHSGAPLLDVGPPVTDVLTRQADLTSPEITVALNQLLTEWTIFASSGLFGIGPGGAEHPIYRRIAGLSMAEVLAGRWEKATPELRRTISDYVNAWRHEQGVAYNPSETFEHYLRRVVHRILKRQRA